MDRKLAEVQVTIEAADCVVEADFIDGMYTGTVKDVSDLPAASKSRTFTCTGKQFAAIVALLLEPSGEPVATDECYKLAEQVVGDWPQNLRPIP